jgi:hypothetical protein
MLSPYAVWALVPAVSAALVNAVFAFWQIEEPRFLDTTRIL